MQSNLSKNATHGFVVGNPARLTAEILAHRNVLKHDLDKVMFEGQY